MQFHVANVNVVVSGLMASILRSCHAECQRKCAMLRCFNKSARKSSPCSERSGCERDKIRPARLAVVKNETKFALHAQNMRKSGISSELGEFCTEYEVSRFLLGEFFHGTVAGRAVLGQIFRADWHCAQVLEATRRPPCRHWWGIAPPRSRPTTCRRRVGSTCRAFPPLYSVASVCVCGVPSCAAGAPYLRCSRIPHSYNKTARRAAGRGWSGRRESNPPLKLGKLPFYR